jgi:energy-coupling factor transporter ATP-binding protein EcfA2
MLSRVVIKNFKSIGETGVDLELKPLTLLVGPNGGGKSSILEAIAVASQQNYSGRLVSFPSPESIIRKPGSSTATIEILFTIGSHNGMPGFRHIAGPQGQNQIIHLLNSSNIDPEVQQSINASINVSMSQLHSNTFLISSVRGDVPYSVNTGGNPGWVGVHGESLLLLLGIIFGQRRFDVIVERIIKWSSRFGIEGLKAGLRGNNQSGSDYLDDELKVVLELALSSSGARQILTVITQLFWAPPGGLLLIEEPEISLHPKAQIDVLEMFAEAIKEQKQIVATTHSVFMLQALGYAVLKGWLTRDQIIVHHVEKRKGGTTAIPLPLSKNGYIKNWVPSFSKVERHLLREWAKTLPRD